MYPYEVQTLIRLQNLFYHGGIPEGQREKYTPMETLIPVEKDKRVFRGIPYSIVSYDEDGHVHYRDPTKEEVKDAMVRDLDSFCGYFSREHGSKERGCRNEGLKCPVSTSFKKICEFDDWGFENLQEAHQKIYEFMGMVEKNETTPRRRKLVTNSV